MGIRGNSSLQDAPKIHFNKKCTKFLYFSAQNPAREAYTAAIQGIRSVHKRSASFKVNSWLHCNLSTIIIKNVIIIRPITTIKLVVISVNYKSGFHEFNTDVQYPCQISFLTFERSRSKFKVKTAGLELQIVIDRSCFKLSIFAKSGIPADSGLLEVIEGYSCITGCLTVDN